MPDQSIGALTGGESTWSDDRSWHFSAVPTAPSDVRFQGVKQPCSRNPKTAEVDPTRTSPP